MTTVSLKEQLMHLRNLTIRFGVLHEAQILQLRNYPLLIPGVEKAQTKIDTEKHIVTYECLTSKKFRKSKKVKEAFSAIKIWTQTLIWEDTVIEIRVNDRDIYDSRIDNDK